MDWIVPVSKLQVISIFYNHDNWVTPCMYQLCPRASRTYHFINNSWTSFEFKVLQVFSSNGKNVNLTSTESVVPDMFVGLKKKTSTHNRAPEEHIITIEGGLQTGFCRPFSKRLDSELWIRLRLAWPAVSVTISRENGASSRIQSWSCGFEKANRLRPLSTSLEVWRQMFRLQLHYVWL